MTAINRPFMLSFRLDTMVYSDTKLEQFHKLARNYIVSLDLGCPSAKHVTFIGPGESTDNMDERQKYLAWVKGWKQIYKELSATIRLLKQFRKTIHFPKLTKSQLEKLRSNYQGSNQMPAQVMRGLSTNHLERLQETAMALLNARYNYKLAAGARRAQLHTREETRAYVQEAA